MGPELFILGAFLFIGVAALVASVSTDDESEHEGRHSVLAAMLEDVEVDDHDVSLIPVGDPIQSFPYLGVGMPETDIRKLAK